MQPQILDIFPAFQKARDLASLAEGDLFGSRAAASVALILTIFDVALMWSLAYQTAAESFSIAPRPGRADTPGSFISQSH